MLEGNVKNGDKVLLDAKQDEIAVTLHLLPGNGKTGKRVRQDRGRFCILPSHQGDRSRKTGDGSVSYRLTKKITFPGKTKYSVQPTNQRRNYKPG